MIPLEDSQVPVLLKTRTQRYVMKVHRLSAFACVYFILNDDFSDCTEDSYLSDTQLLFYQTHLTQKDLNETRLQIE